LFFRYQKPLFRSLGWIPQPFSVSQLAGTGVVLSMFVVLLQQVILRTPEIETPFERMLADPVSRVAIAIFGVTLAPVVEELLFRGFLQPVLVAAAGVFPGIFLTSVLFGGLHLAQNAGQWQSGFLIAIVGFVLGVIRHISGSTRASAITHIAYNSLPCVALLLEGIPTHK
jgi:membrane protease YdiL (CAAX protease family)